MSDPLILHILPAFVPYGAERCAVELAARLPSRGFRTKLVSLFGPGIAATGHHGLMKELRSRNIRFSSLAPDRNGSRVHTVTALRRILQEEPARVPAIIHTQLFGPDFWISVARLFVASHGRPVHFISTAQNVDPDDSAIRRVARRWCMRRMDGVAAISEDVARYVREDLGVPGDRVRLIPNGVDMDQIMLRRQVPFANPARILMIGRLVPQKGHETALRALAKVKAPWRIDLAGAGPLQRELKELAEKLGIGARVRFLGERKDVPMLLRDADLLLFPSRWEGQGIALVETMAAGVPILASDVPAIRELLPRACLVDPLAIENWTAAISGVLANPTSAIERATRLAPEARKRYDVEGMIDRYVAFYRDILS